MSSFTEAGIFGFLLSRNSATTLFDGTETSVYAGSTRILWNAAKDACDEIRKRGQTQASSSTYTHFSSHL